MSILSKRRGSAMLVAVGALLISAFALVPQADASTIYACVKTKGGTVHFVTKKAKCKKGESKASWNTSGPAGPAGPAGAAGKEGPAGKNGTNGTNGTNGAVAGYSSTQVGTVNVTGEEELVVSKTLPAGHYLVSAKAETAAAGTSSGTIETRCEIYDETTRETLDESQWIGAMGSAGILGDLATSTLPMQAVVNSSTSVTVQVWCETQFNNVTSGEVTVSNGKLSAIQTSSNS